MSSINVVSVGAQGPQGPPGATGAAGDGIAVGAPTVRAFPFTHATGDILTGAPLYTPTVGDVLLDAWIEIDTAWDGTQPRGDIGTFAETNGLYAEMSSFVDMTVADDSGATGVLDLGAAALSGLVGQSGPGARRVVPAVFTTTDPIMVCVSQSASPGGDDPGSTQGSAVLYLVTATPGGSSEGGGGGGGGLPAWFLTSSTTGSNGAPLNTVNTPTGDTPYLYWDDTGGTGLWITPTAEGSGSWVGIGRIANSMGPGLTLGSPFLSGPAPTLQAVNGDSFWELILSSAGGVGWGQLYGWMNGGQFGQLFLSGGNPNDVGATGGASQLCIDMQSESTGIWQWNNEQSTPSWVPYGVNTDVGFLEFVAYNAGTNVEYALGSVGPGFGGSDLGLISLEPTNASDWLPLNALNPGDVISVLLNSELQSGLPDIIDYSGTLVVWDQAGTNMLTAVFNGNTGQDIVTPLVMTLFSSVGDDLTVTDAGITSAAGGIYNVLLKASCGWD